MLNARINQRTIFILMFIGAFLVFYFLFLTEVYIFPKNYNIPFIIFIGFSMIIGGIFYFFLKFIHVEEGEINYNVKFINEDSFNVILLILMLVTYFIPPIQFSEIIIDWNQVSGINLFRAIVFLIGSLFIPGSCINSILFRKHSLSNLIHVEPIFIKMIFYPMISICFLGSTSLILDQVGLNRIDFSFVLLLMILSLLVISIILKNYKTDQKRLARFRQVKISISNEAIFLSFIALAIIIISIGMYSSMRYSFVIDVFRANSYTNLIGIPNVGPFDKFYTYAVYWSYISFSISVLCGIPVMNVNVMLVIFIYTFVCSLFMLFKAFLNNLNRNLAILASIITVTFSGLYLIIQYDTLEPEFTITSRFIFEALFAFQFKGFSLVLAFLCVTILVNIFNGTNTRNSFNNEDQWKILLLSAYFLIQSVMIYFLPGIPILILIITYVIISRSRMKSFKIYFRFLAFLFGLFIFYDLIFNSFLSWIFSAQISYFSQASLLPSDLDFQQKLIMNAIFIYLILISFLILNVLFYRILVKVKLTRLKEIYANFNFKLVLSVFLIIFTIMLSMDIIFNEIYTKRGLTYFTLILYLFFFNIGYFGILSIYLLYFSFKRSKLLTMRMSIWFVSIVLLSYIVILFYWISNPLSEPSQLSSNKYFSMMYWFERTWYYEIIPIALIFSLGLFEIIKKAHLIKKSKKLKGTHNLPLLLSCISLIIFLTMSNTIISSIELYNYQNQIGDKEANIIGWTTSHIPLNSKMLVERGILYGILGELTRRKTYRLDLEVESIFQNFKANNETWDIFSRVDDNCSFYPIYKNNDYSAVTIRDNNNTGMVASTFDFNPQYYGVFNFSISISNTSSSFTMNFTSSSGVNGMQLLFESNKLFFFNGSAYVELSAIHDNHWYECQVNFESTTGGFSGLNQYEWSISINATDYGPFFYENNVSSIDKIAIQTDLDDANYDVQLSDMNFSWALDFDILFSIFNFLILIDNLSKNQVNYLIISQDYNFTINGLRVDIMKELVPFFYSELLYQYADFFIFSH